MTTTPGLSALQKSPCLQGSRRFSGPASALPTAVRTAAGEVVDLRHLTSVNAPAGGLLLLEKEGVTRQYRSSSSADLWFGPAEVPAVPREQEHGRLPVGALVASTGRVQACASSRTRHRADRLGRCAAVAPSRNFLVDAVAPVASPRHSEEREAGIVAIEVSMRRELERARGVERHRQERAVTIVTGGWSFASVRRRQRGAIRLDDRSVRQECDAGGLFTGGHRLGVLARCPD